MILARGTKPSQYLGCGRRSIASHQAQDPITIPQEVGDCRPIYPLIQKLTLK